MMGESMQAYLHSKSELTAMTSVCRTFANCAWEHSPAVKYSTVQYLQEDPPCSRIFSEFCGRSCSTSIIIQQGI